MLRGSRAELTLQPARFLFRPLELPQRATEFLDGVVRAQIDRLTPWSANDAAFGWSAPAQAGTDRIVVTVAATARALVQPLIDALIAAGAEAVSVTAAPRRTPRRSSVFEQSARGALDVARVRRALVAVLLGTGLLAGVSLSAAAVVGLQSRQRAGRTDAPHRGAAHGAARRPRGRHAGRDAAARARAPQAPERRRA